MKLTQSDYEALEYVRLFMEEAHLERSDLPRDLMAVAHRGMTAVEKVLATRCACHKTDGAACSECPR